MPAVCSFIPKIDLLVLRWVWKKWGGPKQLEDKKTKTLMMLPYVKTYFHLRSRILTEIPFIVRIIFSLRTKVSRNTPNHMLMTRSFSSKSKGHNF
jgi:hypothetical protein